MVMFKGAAKGMVVGLVVGALFGCAAAPMPKSLATNTVLTKKFSIKLGRHLR
jgi:hypothetical protein